jgi:hypothetical protein
MKTLRVTFTTDSAWLGRRLTYHGLRQRPQARVHNLCAHELVPQCLVLDEGANVALLSDYGLPEPLIFCFAHCPAHSVLRHHTPGKRVVAMRVTSPANPDL